MKSAKTVMGLLLLHVGAAWGIDVPLPSDVSFRMAASPSRGISAGHTIELTLSVTNNGPVALKTVPILSSNFYDQFDLASTQSDCFIVLIVADDGTPYSYYYIWYPTDEFEMEVGETRVCHIKLALTRAAPFVTAFSFGLPDFYVDANPANDRAAVYLQKAVDSVPMLSPAIEALLAMLIAATGLCFGLGRTGRNIVRINADGFD